MTEKKLVVVVMGENCERFIDMCLESVKDADYIIYCDGGSTDNTLNYLKEQDFHSSIVASISSVDDNGKWTDRIPTRLIIHNEYNQEDKGMNGKQRNFYLNFLKLKFPNCWCLALDADEVVEDLSKIKEWINKYDAIGENYPCVSVKMRHFIQDLGHEDSTVPEHFVPHRLFKVKEGLWYPEVEHPVLQYKQEEAPQGYVCRDTTIWHLAYIPNLWDIKRRYDNHLAKSNMHTPEYLKQWYYAHIFGRYPKQQINLTDIPEVIFKKFNIDKDEFYFANRGIETKHPMMVRQWYEYFKPVNVLDLGCGRGPYLYFWNWFVGKENCRGFDSSRWAINNSFTPGQTQVGDIGMCWCTSNEYDLITAIDVLEHLDDKQLDMCLKEMSAHGKRFLFSVPVVGDPNLMNDKTHRQFRTKDEWVILWESYGIKILPTPDNWLFKEQLFIGTKDETSNRKDN